MDRDGAIKIEEIVSDKQPSRKRRIEIGVISWFIFSDITPLSRTGEITFGLRYRRYHNITEFRLVGVQASSEFKGDRVRGVELPRDPIYIASRCTERERERERGGGRGGREE